MVVGSMLAIRGLVDLKRRSTYFLEWVVFFHGSMMVIEV
jgi:hypothetical protein